MINKKNKNAQVTIFIIIAIVIIAGVVALLLLLGKTVLNSPENLNPESFIDKCVKDAVSVSTEKVLQGGGRIEPSLFKMYQGENYNYLCYQKDYYLTCINTHPMLKQIAENEIKQDAYEKIKKCFGDLKSDFEARGFSVSYAELKEDDSSMDIIPGGVLISINKRLDISKETSQTFSGFDINVLSPLYGLLMTAREIVNQESQYCNFEYNGFMLLYPEYKIKRIDYDDSKIYIITDRKSGKEFKFAVRSCAFAPGI